MALNLKRRLRVLERFVATSDDDRCGVCGHVQGARPELKVTFDRVDGPDVCLECGRQLVLRLRFDHPLDRGVVAIELRFHTKG